MTPKSKMNKNIIYYFNFILGLLLIGCATTRNYSNREPFVDYVGKEVTLNESTSIWEIYNSNEYGFISFSMKTNGSGYSSAYAQKIIDFPAGTKIMIEKIMRKNIHSTLSSSAVYAICSAKMPDGSLMHFEYTWGLLGDIRIAPWEQIGLEKRKY